MKILIIHNHYLEKGGEDGVVKTESSLLAEYGHKVIFYEKSNIDFKSRSFLDKLYFLLHELNFSNKVYREIKEIIRIEKPDIAHIHNVFICITPAVYFALKEAGVPVVQSLHNYRFFCIRGTFFVKGSVCEACKGKQFFNAVIRRCWRNSFLLSLLLTKLLRKSEAFLNNIDAFIVTSKFSRDKFVELGLNKEKMYLKLNCLMSEPKEDIQDDNYALFIGRLVDYKGIKTLIKAFKLAKPFNLKIIGDGPLSREVQSFVDSYSNVKWLGKVERSLLNEEIRNSSFVIFPSECYENMPLVIMESFAYSKPVLASNLGAAKEFVVEGVSGMLFEPANEKDLAEKAVYLFANRDKRIELGKNAHKIYQECFNKEKNYEDLINIYSKVISQKRFKPTILSFSDIRN